MSKYFTMIGSRQTPENVCEALAELALTYTRKGWIGRSGGADGADTCLEDGSAHPTGNIEVYLPWRSFNGRSSDGKTYFDVSGWESSVEAHTMASELHPAWNRVSFGARKLHARNIYQILGKDLATPSDCVICYARPIGDKGYVSGGTATAVKIAIDKGIPVFNLWYRDSFRKAMEFLNEQSGSEA